MPELIQLTDRIVDGMEVEVCCDIIGIWVVGRMLHWAELKISCPLGTTTMPPGCWPVVRLMPVQPIAKRCSSARCRTMLCSSAYFLTNPIAVLSATVAMVPALNTWSLPNSVSVYRCAPDWYSPEKFKSISGVLSPSNPRKVSKGMVWPSRL